MVSVLLGLLGCWFIVYAYRAMDPATASVSAPARSDRNEKHLIQFRKDVEAAITAGEIIGDAALRELVARHRSRQQLLEQLAQQIVNKRKPRSRKRAA